MMLVKMNKVLFLVVVFFTIASTAYSNGVATIKHSFLGVPCQITLYKIQPLLEAQIQLAGGEEKVVNPNRFLNLSYTREGGFWSEYLSFKNRNISSFLAIDKVSGRSRVIKYDKERIQEEIFDWLRFVEKHQESNLYQLGIMLKKGVKKNKRGKTYVQNLGHVPVALSHGKEYSDRSNLFDMFSKHVDLFLFLYGIGETISHKNHVDDDEYDEDQFQISILGSIEIESLGYFAFGFFQYTFNRDGVCYHRAFKPWTSDCLKRLSNSMTQMLIRNALYGWLDGLQTREPVDDVEVDILKKFKQYNFSEACINELAAAL